MILRRWIQLRANCLPIQNRQKTFDKNKMIVGPDRRYVCPLCKEDDEELDHFLRKSPLLLNLREIYLHGINLMLPGILQNSDPTTIFRVGVYIDQSLIRRKSFIWLISFVVRLGTLHVEFCFLCAFVIRTVVNFLACLLFIIYFCVYIAHGFLKYTYLSIYVEKTHSYQNRHTQTMTSSIY